MNFQLSPEMEKQFIDVGNRLRNIRLALKMSQKEFAATIDLKQSKLSDLEIGNHACEHTILADLYHKYNINPVWLLFGEGERTVTKKVFNSPNTLLYELEIEKSISKMQSRQIKALTDRLDRLESDFKAAVFLRNN